MIRNYSWYIPHLSSFTVAFGGPFEISVLTHCSCCWGPFWKQSTCTWQSLLGALWKQSTYLWSSSEVII